MKVTRGSPAKLPDSKKLENDKKFDKIDKNASKTFESEAVDLIKMSRKS